MFYRIIIVCFFILFGIFFVQNSQIVEVRFLFWRTETSRALVLLITFIGGLLAGWASAYIRRRKMNEKAKKDQLSLKTTKV